MVTYGKLTFSLSRKLSIPAMLCVFSVPGRKKSPSKSKSPSRFGHVAVLQKTQRPRCANRNGERVKPWSSCQAVKLSSCPRAGTQFLATVSSSEISVSKSSSGTSQTLSEYFRISGSICPYLEAAKISTAASKLSWKPQ